MNKMTNPENPILCTLPFAGTRVIEVGGGAGGFTLNFLTQASEIVCVEKGVESYRMMEEEWQASGHQARLVHRQAGFEELDTEGHGQFDYAVFAKSF